MAKKKSPVKAARKPTKPAGRTSVKKAKPTPAKKKGGAPQARTTAAKRTATKVVKKAGKKVAKKAALPATRTAPRKVVGKTAQSKPAAKKAAAQKAVVKKSVVKKAAAKKVITKAPARRIAEPSRAKKQAPKTKVVRPAPPAPKASPATPAPAPRHDPAQATAHKAPHTAAPVKKRPAKERVMMEFYLNSSPNALYDLLSTPSGFSEWYCQDVDVRGDQYTFIWDGEREATTMIGRKLGEVIRFRRNDDDDPEAFFEFRVRIDAMTNEVCLVVTDHAWPDEVEETRNLWTSQIETLSRVLGA